MADKQCAECGELNPEQSNFCSNCGKKEFKDVPPGLAARLRPQEAAVDNDVRLGIGRVVILSLLSAGIYILWWFYVTWKQLARETNEVHYPVWHALTLFVPIYNLFRMHQHVSVIKNVAIGAGLTTSLSASLAVVMWGVSNAMGFALLRVEDQGAIFMLTLLATVLSTTVVYLAQGTLNQFWQSVRGVDLREARVGVGEVILVVLGILLWLGILFPA